MARSSAASAAPRANNQIRSTVATPLKCSATDLLDLIIVILTNSGVMAAINCEKCNCGPFIFALN